MRAHYLWLGNRVLLKVIKSSNYAVFDGFSIC